ncbi:hypothetical protein HDF24_21290 [Mucilaginibacter sp. X4EP1]|uniref:hypothetical protein n=1 Tax=Mucilaginibacter sp. X4EP1 TaxID=2723092 RepID=UPI002167448C|nr:hypothetical protein [Mucilaginibacter sp. X4EP1]MCS3812484.1 hypothetical protein [Mucilaginibacter sp. X4EP1]
MKRILAILTIFVTAGCGHGFKPGNKKTAEIKVSIADTTGKPIIQYTDRQLEFFLDSVGKLSTKLLANKEAFYADSIFKNQRQLDTLISDRDLKALKKAIRKGAIRVSVARRIFNNPAIDSSCTEKSVFLTYKQGLTPIELYPFSKNKGTLNEYAVCIGDPDHCPNACLYFFKGKRVIAMHNFYERFESGLYHYQDSDGKTVIYYCYMFAEGSNEWWFNYFFYKYDGNKLIPVLNELENGNVTAPVERALWLESTIEKNNPLTIKMVYYNQFPASENDIDFGPYIIKDSTTVQYRWDERSKTYQGNYEQSKITRPQIISYYLSSDNLLFINAHYQVLKNGLQDKNKRVRILHYLSEVKADGSNHRNKKSL